MKGYPEGEWVLCMKYLLFGKSTFDIDLKLLERKITYNGCYLNFSISKYI